jgi:segregation and condensation protein B
MENIKHIIESLLFVAEEPLTVDRIKSILSQAETAEIRSAAADLAAEYEERQGGFYLDEVAGGYQIRTRPEYTEWIKKLIQPKPLRLSKPALETLVIIAYKQPIIRSDIEHIRGVDCGGVLRVLLERKLIRVLGRKEIAGRPLIYATTKRFLEIFDLKSLRDLPTPKEIEELGAAANEGTTTPMLDTAATSETLLESSGGIEAAGERIEETESPGTGPAEDEPARDTLRTAENDREPETEADDPDQPIEKSS